jgi:hypothetical protein
VTSSGFLRGHHSAFARSAGLPLVRIADHSCRNSFIRWFAHAAQRQGSALRQPAEGARKMNQWILLDFVFFQALSNSEHWQTVMIHRQFANEHRIERLNLRKCSTVIYILPTPNTKNTL